MYAPLVQSARTIKNYKFGPYEAAFMDQIVAEGPVEYKFIIVVFKEGATDPFLFVTSEKNDPKAAAKFLEELGLESEGGPTAEGGSHFLCLFDGDGHANLGDSNDWGDAEKFEAEALQMLTKRLGHPPVVD